MLTAAVDERLEPLFARMGMNQRFGKLEFAKHLELFGERELRFIQMMSVIRNALAHGLGYLDFNIESHVQSLGSKQAENFYAVLTEMSPYCGDPTWASQCKADPKTSILHCAAQLIREALAAGSIHKIGREESEHALREMISGRLVPYDSWMDPPF